MLNSSRIIFYLYFVCFLIPNKVIAQCGIPGVDNAAAFINCNGSNGSVWIQFSSSANNRQAQAILVPSGTVPSASTSGWVNASQTSGTAIANSSGSYDLYIRWADCSNVAKVEPGWFGGNGSSYTSNCSGNSEGTPCSINSSISSAHSSMCQTVYLSANTGSNPTDATYQWFENSVQLGYGSTITLNNINAGNHTYTLVVSKNGCGNSPSSTTSSIISVSQCPTNNDGGGVTFNNMGSNVGININNVGQSLGGLGSFSLAVNNKIIANEVRVRTGWADYVFNKNYKLMPLKYLEIYIKKNRHLPGIPSAKQVEKQGLDLGKSNKLLLEKIEELTLHLIQQRKKIKALEAKL